MRGAPSAGRIHGGQLVLDQLDVVATGELVQVERRWRPEPERRRDRRLPMLERMLGGEKIDFEVAAGEVTERQHRLDGGDSGAGNQYPMHERTLARCRVRHIRIPPPPEAGNYGAVPAGDQHDRDSDLYGTSAALRADGKRLPRCLIGGRPNGG